MNIVKKNVLIVFSEDTPVGILSRNTLSIAPCSHVSYKMYTQRSVSLFHRVPFFGGGKRSKKVKARLTLSLCATGRGMDEGWRSQ
jgi:hypothetical protein